MEWRSIWSCRGRVPYERSLSCPRKSSGGSLDSGPSLLRGISAPDGELSASRAACRLLSLCASLQAPGDWPEMEAVGSLHGSPGSGLPHAPASLQDLSLSAQPAGPTSRPGTRGTDDERETAWKVSGGLGSRGLLLLPEGLAVPAVEGSARGACLGRNERTLLSLPGWRCSLLVAPGCRSDGGCSLGPLSSCFTHQLHLATRERGAAAGPEGCPGGSPAAHSVHPSTEAFGTMSSSGSRPDQPFQEPFNYMHRLVPAPSRSGSCCAWPWSHEDHSQHLLSPLSPLPHVLP